MSAHRAREGEDAPRRAASRGRNGPDAAHSFDANRPDTSYVVSSRAPFLSTLTPGRDQWRAAVVVVLISVALFLAVVPFAAVPLTPLLAFLPVYQSALIVVDLITVTLLLGQYAILKSRSLLVLACAYLFGGLMAIAHALSFPGLFAPGGLIGGGQTTAWLYFLWHAGFPLFVVAYALLKNREARPSASGTRVLMEALAGIGLTLAAAALCLAIAQWVATALPLMADNLDAQAKAMVATLTWIIGIASLALLWLRKPHSVIDLWLMVVLCVWAADTALASVFNHGRYDVGWYAGRIYGLLASSFVLAVLLLENSMLYARLVEANEAQRRRSLELQRLSTKLEAANRELDAFAGGLAHDLQQPLTTIGAFAQVIQRQGSNLAATEASHLQRIINAAGVANRMIRSLLEFARLGQRKIRAVPVDLNRLVQEARSSLDDDAGAAQVSWKVSPLPVVHGDASLLLLAVVNLMSNAAKYSRGREGAEIQVDGHAESDGSSWLCIQDNGVGFEMALAIRLFKPFSRLHAPGEFEGTGMGLANVRRIMDRHGGTIDVQAAPGEGAAFTLVFPPPAIQALYTREPSGDSDPAPI